MAKYIVFCDGQLEYRLKGQFFEISFRCSAASLQAQAEWQLSNDEVRVHSCFILWTIINK